jgi:hypothetical protein
MKKMPRRHVFWPLLGALAVAGLLLALRELRRKRREVFA